MTMSISHYQLDTRDLSVMQDFYTRVLGFVVTDSGVFGEQRRKLVFMSLNPGEHHQLVLTETDGGKIAAGAVNHLAFRVADLAALRAYHGAVDGYGDLPIETISHGNTWSFYFRDPEGNRVEIFTGTPWHVAQPCRFDIDLSMPDEELTAWTLERVTEMADFKPIDEFYGGLGKRLEGSR